MGMPDDLVLVRHGESEGNVVTGAAKDGDLSGYTETFMATPGSQWRLTERGRTQAATIGAWLNSEFKERRRDNEHPFDRHFVSPYVRTRETAACLDLDLPRWRLNRAIRERDWGDISLIPREQYMNSEWWAESAKLKRLDPLYWCAPNGESVAMMAEDRIRNALDTMHRECSGRAVIGVAHAETIQAFRLVLERMSDEKYAAVDADRSQNIANCEMLHYTRLDPFTPIRSGDGPRRSDRLTWLRRAKPVEVDGIWSVEVSPWSEIEFTTYSNAELMDTVTSVPSLFPAARPLETTP